MHTTIWKQVLEAEDRQTISVPEGAELLCAREQGASICVCFRCDPSQPKESRTILVVGTGNTRPLPEGRFLGTASLERGALMFHVFERTI